MSGTKIGDEEAAQRLDQLNRLGFQLFQQKLYPQALEILGQVVELANSFAANTMQDLGVALLNRGRSTACWSRMPNARRTTFAR